MDGEGTDVVVVGSGGAGLAAALSAAVAGAQVTVLERTELVGGSTAVSGGGIWVPGNHHMPEAGVEDSPDEALAYCRRLVAGKMPDELVETFVDQAPEMIRYLETNTSLRFRPMSWPDYHPEIEGARRGGRMLESEPFPSRLLGEWAARVRTGPVLTAPITLEEQSVTWRLGYSPEKLDRELIKERAAAGLVTMGRALISGLLEACLGKGVRLVTNARAIDLVRADTGAITGIRYLRTDSDSPVTETRALDMRDTELRAPVVVLASGGYEWDTELTRSFLPGPLTHPTTPPFGSGDGLRMAMDVGAGLANMSEAWWYPASNVPDDTYEGLPLNRFVATERTAPHCILVNRSGRRFVNEAANYNDMMKAFFDFDPVAYRFRNLPCWSVMDEQYRRRYSIASARPGRPDPDWLIRAGSLNELADRLGVDAGGLGETVERFNQFARAGRDPDFGRGDSYYDRFHGDPEAPHPNLGTIEVAPFYALAVHPGCVGTKGGPVTDSRGRVLDTRGRVIPGLFAAGNVAASPAGPAYFGGGCSIAMALTWGYLAGRSGAEIIRSRGG